MFNNSQFNFNPLANFNDGSCVHFVYGCTDESQFNFDSVDSGNDGSCIPFVYG